MPHITFIYPCIGRFTNTKYVRSWQMQPLCIGVLSSLTPSTWERVFYDDRLEAINYDINTDLVAISIETYSALRGYQIANEFRKRNIPVVMGGFHATFCPEEVLEHADAICIGEAENVWNDILNDAIKNQLQKIYKGSNGPVFSSVPDRTIFEGKNYLDMALIEHGRGCKFNCKFCSIAAFYKNQHHRREVSEVFEEIKSVGSKNIFFVDDNIASDVEALKELLRAIIPLKIRWFSQISVNIVEDQELIDLMTASGCVGVLVGFESLSPENLSAMNKQSNKISKYKRALERFRKAGIVIYGTFVFGYPEDNTDLFNKSVDFAKREKMFIAAFNHLVPFPGTPFYDQVKEANRLFEDKWWLNTDYRFGQVAFDPFCNYSAKDIENVCFEMRKQFYSFGSILKRSLEYNANCGGFERLKYYFLINLLLRHEVHQKKGLPLGLRNIRSDEQN